MWAHQCQEGPRPVLHAVPNEQLRASFGPDSRRAKVPVGEAIRHLPQGPPVQHCPRAHGGGPGRGRAAVGLCCPRPGALAPPTRHTMRAHRVPTSHDHVTCAPTARPPPRSGGPAKPRAHSVPRGHWATCLRSLRTTAQPRPCRAHHTPLTEPGLCPAGATTTPPTFGTAGAPERAQSCDLQVALTACPGSPSSVASAAAAPAQPRLSWVGAGWAFGTCCPAT